MKQDHRIDDIMRQLEGAPWGVPDTMEPMLEPEPQGPEPTATQHDKGRNGLRARGVTRPPIHKRKRRARNKASRKARKVNRIK